MRRTLILLGIIGLTLILAPILAYWWHFHSLSLSDKPSDWAAFGDFMGGTMNTVVAFISLLVLAWISYIIAQNSNKEARNHHFLIKRIEVYDKLNSYTLSAPTIFRKINIHANYMHKFQKTNVDTDEQWADYVKNVSIELLKIFEMCDYIVSFDTLAGHLFEYDFKSQKFKDIIQATESLNEYMKAFEKGLTDETIEFKFEDNPLEVMNFSLQVEALLKALKNEISYKV